MPHRGYFAYKIPNLQTESHQMLITRPITRIDFTNIGQGFRPYEKDGNIGNFSRFIWAGNPKYSRISVKYGTAECGLRLPPPYQIIR